MIKTERFVNINDIPASGQVLCPACGCYVNLEAKYCPNCNAVVDYINNINILRHWDIDLVNFQVVDIEEGIVDYKSVFAGDNYHNLYDLKERCNIIPDKYSAYPIRQCSRTGVYTIKTWEGKYGMLDRRGTFIIEPVCDAIGDIDNRGNFIITYKGKSGVKNIKNENIIPVIYDSVRRTSNVFIVSLSGKYGMLDAKNRIIIPVEYDDIGEFSNDPIPVCKSGKWGLYDCKTSNLVVPTKFDKIEQHIDKFFMDEYQYDDEIMQTNLPLHNSEIRKIYDGNRVGAKDQRTGEVIIEPMYEMLCIDESGLITVMKDNKWGVFFKDGRMILPLEYIFAHISEGLIIVTGPDDPNTSGLYKISHGIINRFGYSIIPIKRGYGAISKFYNGLCTYESPCDWCRGIMDKFGNYVEYRPTE